MSKLSRAKKVAKVFPFTFWAIHGWFVGKAEALGMDKDGLKIWMDRCNGLRYETVKFSDAFDDKEEAEAELSKRKESW